MPIAVSGDRPTPQQRITQAIDQDRAAGEPTKLRILVQIYDRSSMTYRQIPDIFWGLQATETTPEEIEATLEAVGKCLIAISERGAGEVLALIGRTGD